MEKIKLNISGNLVGIKIPSTVVFEIIEVELKRIVIKNYKFNKIIFFLWMALYVLTVKAIYQQI